LNLTFRIDYNSIHNTLVQASERDDLEVEVIVEEVSITAPCFLIDVDVNAGAATNETLIFGETTWASGHYAVGPDNATNVSAFQVLDEIVDFYMDRDRFPSLHVRYNSFSLLN
jgi:hypothetical protein